MARRLEGVGGTLDQVISVEVSKRAGVGVGEECLGLAALEPIYPIGGSSPGGGAAYNGRRRGARSKSD